MPKDVQCKINVENRKKNSFGNIWWEIELVRSLILDCRLKVKIVSWPT